MSAADASNASRIERSSALLVSVLSEGRRHKVRLMTGERRNFGLSPSGTVVNVPYPALEQNWTLRSVTCGIALQCAPSKEQLSHYPLHQLTTRQLLALSIIEGRVALGWISSTWPGLMPELRRLLPNLEATTDPMDGAKMLDRAQALAQSGQALQRHPLLGQLPVSSAAQRRVLAAIKKMYGQMPWSSKRPLSRALHTIPVSGQGGEHNPNLPPPSHPDEDNPEISADQRSGIPYPEWNAWRQRFLIDHVAVLERKLPPSRQKPKPVPTDVRRWFEAHTHRAMRNRLEDGSDIDIDQYINFYIGTLCGTACEPRLFRDLQPAARDVTTALLLDGSSSLGVAHGTVFQLELDCADALCRAMAQAGERHGLFLFSGNTRHRVEVTCLKDFDDRQLAVPSDLGLAAGGYTRLGAPIRHLTSRLLAQPSERRLLIVIGDGLMSDEGYEGKYAWADVAHALDEAGDAGVSVYYIGVGATRVDPLPDVFGSRRSTRIRRIEQLPQILSQVHRELISA